MQCAVEETHQNLPCHPHSGFISSFFNTRLNMHIQWYYCRFTFQWDTVCLSAPDSSNRLVPRLLVGEWFHHTPKAWYHLYSIIRKCRMRHLFNQKHIIVAQAETVLKPLPLDAFKDTPAYTVSVGSLFQCKKQSHYLFIYLFFHKACHTVFLQHCPLGIHFELYFSCMSCWQDQSNSDRKLTRTHLSSKFDCFM